MFTAARHYQRLSCPPVMAMVPAILNEKMGGCPYIGGKGSKRKAFAPSTGERKAHIIQN